MTPLPLQSCTKWNTFVGCQVLLLYSSSSCWLAYIANSAARSEQQQGSYCSMSEGIPQRVSLPHISTVKRLKNRQLLPKLHTRYDYSPDDICDCWWVPVLACTGSLLDLQRHMVAVWLGLGTKTTWLYQRFVIFVWGIHLFNKGTSYFVTCKYNFLRNNRWHVRERGGRSANMTKLTLHVTSFCPGHIINYSIFNNLLYHSSHSPSLLSVHCRLFFCGFSSVLSWKKGHPCQ